jgi:hypothetical protein
VISSTGVSIGSDVESPAPTNPPLNAMFAQSLNPLKLVRCESRSTKTAAAPPRKPHRPRAVPTFVA